MAAAEQALKIAPANREAQPRARHRLRGAVGERAEIGGARPRRRRRRREPREGDSASRGGARARRSARPIRTCARRWRGSTCAAARTTRRFRCSPISSTRSRAGRTARCCSPRPTRAPAAADDAIAWLEERRPTIRGCCRRSPTSTSASGAGPTRPAPTRARCSARRATRELKSRYASALLNAGGRENVDEGARRADRSWSRARADATRARCICCRRRSGGSATPQAAEATARRVIAQNSESPWGYFALAEALEERRQYQAVVDALAPVVAEYRGKSARPAFDVSILLPHLGFAYQELGQYDKAIADVRGSAQARAERSRRRRLPDRGEHRREEVRRRGRPRARRRSPQHPDDLRLTRLEAQALRQRQGRRRASRCSKTRSSSTPTTRSRTSRWRRSTRRPIAARRRSRCCRTRRRSSRPTTRSPSSSARCSTSRRSSPKPKSAFRQVLARDPENAPALNYLGYMLAERGERLDESVDYLKKALQIEPDNGSYLDSLGWAYFKADKLDLADDNLKRAADQLKTNSVIQDHYGEVLFKLGRYDEAIAAWTRALAGDGDSIDQRGHRQEDPRPRSRSSPRSERSRRASAASCRLLRPGGSARRVVVRRAADEAAAGPGRAGARRRRRARRRRPRACRARPHADRRSRRQRIGRRPARSRAGCSAGVAAPASARLEAVAPFGAAALHLRRRRRRRDAAAAARRPRARARPSRRRARGGRRRAAERRRSARRADRLRAGADAGRRPRSSATTGAWCRSRRRDELYLHRDRRRRAVAARRGRSRRHARRELARRLPRLRRTACRDVDPARQRATRGARSTCTLALSQVETNVALGAEVFRVRRPARRASRSRSTSCDRARPGVSRRLTRVASRRSTSLRVLGVGRRLPRAADDVSVDRAARHADDPRAPRPVRS